MFVFVISKSGKPLMPTTRFGKVRRLLKDGKAKVIQRKPFTIQLFYDCSEKVQPLTLGIDMGTNHIGVAVTKEDGEPVFLAELETRTKEVTKNMQDRKGYRQSRRRYNREKRKRRACKCGTTFDKKEYLISGCEKSIVCKDIKPGMIRFQNRKRTDKWFTPTCNHLFQTHVNLIRKIQKILPITKVVVEYAQFDLHKIQNPEVNGKDYQNGRMYGFTNTQEYVLCRDKHICQMCKKGNRKLHVHHAIWKSKGGSDLPENLITLCESCHEKAHKDPKFAKKVVSTFKGFNKTLHSTTILNSIMPKFYLWLEENFIEVEKTYGYETKDKRREFKLEKSHCIDAYLISLGNIVPFRFLPKPFIFKQFRRHNRANIHYQRERNYYIGKKKVAVNRNKRTGQTFDSLRELTEKEKGILNGLTVKKACRGKRTSKPFNMGDVILFGDKRYVVKGFTNDYLGFIGESKYSFPMSKTTSLIKNTGIVCLN